VNVFTDQPFAGNPLAVYPDAGHLDDATMQRIAREMNLSETTFVGPPSAEGRAAGCGFRVRIFTPSRELPMAGHPTLGTAFALARDGRIDGDRVVFEEGVGPVPVRIERRADRALHFEMEQPAPTFDAPFEDREGLARALGLLPDDLDAALPARVVSCGVPFLMAPLRGLDAAARARPQLAVWDEALAARGVEGVMCFALEATLPGCEVHARMFAPGLGVGEDPATGSACGPLGAHLLETGALGDGRSLAIRIEQGIEMERPSAIDVRVEKTDEGWQVAVGGLCVPMGEGRLEVAA
jgi:trans-2,3-dihydro-3-hydroxyanthranilate isomerase